MADIARLRRIQGEKHPGVPYFLLGHSMGSFLTRTYLIDHPGTVDGAILSGTGRSPPPWWLSESCWPDWSAAGWGMTG